MIFEIDNKLVSSEIFEKKFVCDLNACKGECCVAGDAGAPLEKTEIKEIEKILPIVQKYMLPKGIAQVEKDGVSVLDYDEDYVTPLMDGTGACAFVFFDKNEIAKCAIEAAFLAGEVTFQKPISCHLYPIRVTKLKKHDALNYNQWSVCAPACTCGESLDVPVYKFLQKPLIRRYGTEFYQQLTIAATEFEKTKH